MQGPLYLQSMTFPDPDTTLATADVVVNSSIVAVDDGYYTAVCGTTSNIIALGFLSLGGDRPSKYGDVLAWSPSVFYLNQSVTTSNSFGLHIGSAALSYPPSMYHGGYDRGRTIGPAVTYGKSAPYLQDIIIGVETGVSTFDFDSQSDLLVDSSGAHNSLPISFQPMAPYLSLPRQTCDKIASFLPVTYDQATNLYLWNTADDRYRAIVTSPAYLGFVFPSGAASPNPVTIKVPFQLLNLTLEPLLSGQQSSVPYFPCHPYEASGEIATDDWWPTSGTYILGRAFLQAAFLGKNWGNCNTWVVQAPGPGGSHNGLGEAVPEIQDHVTTIDSYDDNGLFNSSWSPYWTPVPVSNRSSENIVASHDNGGLSTGTKAGIGVGVAVIALAILGVSLFFLLRRRKSRRSETREIQKSQIQYSRENGQLNVGQYNQSKFHNHGIPYGQHATWSNTGSPTSAAQEEHKAYNTIFPPERHEMYALHSPVELPSERFAR